MRTLTRATVGFAALLVLMGLVSFASAGTVRHDRDPQAYLDLGASFASVGRVDFMIGTDAYIASGVLIDTNWVLTAGHVVSGDTSPTFTLAGDVYPAASWQAHPKWNGDLIAGYDIGLINLSSPVESVTPAQRYKGRKELGAEATIVGYGMTGTGLSGATTFDGEKRGGQNVIDVLFKGYRKSQPLFLCDFDNPDDPGDNFFGSPEPLDLEFLIAPGDSGGGLFLDIGDTWQLAGVNSFIGWSDEDGDSDYGDLSGHTRVSAFNKWIDGVISGGDGNGKGKPDWAGGPGGPNKGLGTVPEPATLALLAVGSLLLIRRRRAG